MKQEGFRKVIRYYKDKAEVYRKQTVEQIEDLRGLVNGRYLKSLEIIYKLYLSVYERIDADKGLFTTEELNPTNEELAQIVMNNR